MKKPPPDQQIMALEKQVLELKNLFHQTADPIIIKTDQGIIIDCNQTFHDIYGYSRDEIIGCHITQLHSEKDDIDQINKNIAARTGEVIPHEYIHLTRDGREIPVEVCTTHICFRGKPAQLSTIRDISRRRLAETALKESEIRFKLAFELSGIGKALSAINGPFYWVNPMMCRIFDYTQEEFSHITSQDLTHPDDRNRSLEITRDLIRGKISDDSFAITKRYRSRTGRTIWSNTTVSLVRGPDRQPLYTIVEVEDITEQYRVRRANQALRVYLTNIIDSMPSFFAGVDRHLNITLWNSKACEITGYTAEQVMGKPVKDFYPSIVDYLDTINRTIQNQMPATLNKVHHTIGSRTVYEDLTVYPVISGGEKGAVIRIDDVTEKVRIEEMMVQSEKMMSIGALAAGMAHEINNPLAGIIQNTQVTVSRLTDRNLAANVKAAEQTGLDFQRLQAYLEKRAVIKHLKMVQASGAQAAKIVVNMLSFVRRSDDVRTECDLAALLEKAIALACSDFDMKKHYDFKRIKIIRDFPDHPLLITCEESKIQQVLFNILKNAAQAMADNRSSRPPVIRFRLFSNDGYVSCEISDNGPGMDADTQKRIFEPFFTTKPSGRGTGLGLSISYFIIVDDHKGSMQVRSVKGHGTTFTVSLPADK